VPESHSSCIFGGVEACPNPEPELAAAVGEIFLLAQKTRCRTIAEGLWVLLLGFASRIIKEVWLTSTYRYERKFLMRYSTVRTCCVMLLKLLTCRPVFDFVVVVVGNLLMNQREKNKS